MTQIKDITNAITAEYRETPQRRTLGNAYGMSIPLPSRIVKSREQQMEDNLFRVPLAKIPTDTCGARPPSPLYYTCYRGRQCRKKGLWTLIKGEPLTKCIRLLPHHFATKMQCTIPFPRYPMDSSLAGVLLPGDGKCG